MRLSINFERTTEMNKIYDPDSELNINNSGFFNPLTQIANRKRFDTMLTQEIERAKNIISYLSILQIGIDYFQHFIDAYDKQKSEACVHQIALALGGCLNRSGDLVTSWSDAKFVCLLTDTDSAGAAQMADRLRRTISDLHIPHIKSPIANVITVSIGVITALLTDETSSDELLQRADQALSRAQNPGHDQIFIWDK